MEMKKLISYENSKIFVEGERLSDVANMYYMTLSDYLDLCKFYLSLFDEEISYPYQLTQSSSQIKDAGCCCRFVRHGGIYVLENGYEDLKKRLFDLAYMCCSEINDKEVIETRKNIELYDDDFRQSIIHFGDTYTSCYKSLNGKWEQVITSTPIDIKDKEKRYSLIQR